MQDLVDGLFQGSKPEEKSDPQPQDDGKAVEEPEKDQKET